MNVLFIAAELAPLAKVGGLADVAGALPKALISNTTDIRAVMPKYSTITLPPNAMKLVAEKVPVAFAGTTEYISIFQTTIPDSQVPLYLIDNPHYLGTGSIYFDEITGPEKTKHEAERFLFFSRAAVALPAALAWYPDIIHCQDWHVGMVPLIKDVLGKSDPKLAKAKTLLTIHNLEYQGWYTQETVLNLLGFSIADHPVLANTKDGMLISLRQGILTADALNAVSQAYAEEILTPEYGAKLEGDIATRRADLSGILNGIDVSIFDPATDPLITKKFSNNDRAGKIACKAALQKTMGLPPAPEKPLLAIVTRLAQQKGVDLLADIADDIAAMGAQLIVLGTGLETLEKLMTDAALRHPESIAVRIGFDNALAHQIYAGSDAFLMPSRYEPCGLGQMIAMRYGALPIVRATGGLKDTVHEVRADGTDGEGFVFTELTADAFRSAIQRAITLYQQPKSWHTVVMHDMELDFSWEASARAYQALYDKLITTASKPHYANVKKNK
ncbi:MAG: glycogen synthase GlgA [Candidatus Kerfeldbacteria bacterium]|nr:glycogen synthase GlgA [Candidatus Kerfeldbacteria bacterium]